MPLIKPFKGLRPSPENASEVIAPPYDVISFQEACDLAKNKPNSFLHISRPEIDLPSGTNPYSSEVYARGATTLKGMIESGMLFRDDQECFYVYELTHQANSQKGLVLSASIAAYDQNIIRKHEFTRPEKEDDRVRQIDTLSAQTGPVLLAYPTQAEVDSILASSSTSEPDLDVIAEDGVRHKVWVVSDASTVKTLQRLFDQFPALYIADGHHRSAAASRVHKLRSIDESKEVVATSEGYFLAVAFPQQQMKILPYNRVVTDLNGLTDEVFLRKIADKFQVIRSDEPLAPDRKGVIGLYLGGSWYRLVADKLPTSANPVDCLDVSMLSNLILGPILGIHDLRKDKRIDFVGGVRGVSELSKRVDVGEMACAFSLFPTGIQELMSIADSGEVMPPKSTWFEPKLADGLVSLVLD